MCNGCWSTKGRSAPSEEDDENEVANAIEASVAAVGIGVALGGDPVTETAEPASDVCDW